MIHRSGLALLFALLATAPAFAVEPLVEPEPHWTELFQRKLANGTVVFIFVLIGISGVTAEISHPGTWYPGIVGIVCLILAFFGLSVLPVNYFGLALIVLGVLLIILEVKVHSAGILTTMGIIALVSGSAFLIDTSQGVAGVHWLAVAPVTIAVGLIMMLLVRNVVRTHRTPVKTGMERMIGELAQVKGELHGEGFVFIAGELWRARCPQTLEDGETVRIVDYDGLTLHVKPLP